MKSPLFKEHDLRSQELLQPSTQPAPTYPLEGDFEPYIANGPFGGPFVPSSNSYILQNAEAAKKMFWYIENPPLWLTFTPSSGIVLPGEEVEVVATPNALTCLLEVGTHTEQYIFKVIFLYGDFNNDGYIDSQDADFMSTCMNGASIPFNAGCQECDFDKDGDVDQSDFGMFQRCLSDAEAVFGCEKDPNQENQSNQNIVYLRG